MFPPRHGRCLPYARRRSATSVRSCARSPASARSKSSLLRVGRAFHPKRRARALALPDKLNVAPRLWDLPPASFSGGEQQRANIARGLATHRHALLLDEPMASLDVINRATVVELIEARKRKGAAILGNFHDANVRQRVADRMIDVTQFAPGA